MTENKRFLVKYLEYEAYYVDTKKEYVDTDYYLELDGYQTMSDEQVVECLNKFFEENEQLKAQLQKGEYVCSICKYQYITKRDTDEYYIAKCKKEHIECSTGTVNYCEDFKCKEATK